MGRAAAESLDEVWKESRLYRFHTAQRRHVPQFTNNSDFFLDADYVFHSRILDNLGARKTFMIPMRKLVHLFLLDLQTWAEFQRKLDEKVTWSQSAQFTHLCLLNLHCILIPDVNMCIPHCIQTPTRVLGFTCDLLLQRKVAKPPRWKHRRKANMPRLIFYQHRSEVGCVLLQQDVVTDIKSAWSVHSQSAGWTQTGSKHPVND